MKRKPSPCSAQTTDLLTLQRPWLLVAAVSSAQQQAGKAFEATKEGLQIAPMYMYTYMTTKYVHANAYVYVFFSLGKQLLTNTSGAMRSPSSWADGRPMAYKSEALISRLTNPTCESRFANLGPRLGSAPGGLKSTAKHDDGVQGLVMKEMWIGHLI